MTSQGFDSDRAVAFAERVQGIVNGGALSLMLSIGHRAGLFDVMRRLGFATSGEIAGEAGLEEAYVREWLGAMASGGIVEFEPERRAYRLPPEHAACLSREARRSNLAVTAQWIPLLAQVEDEVLDCFARGNGPPHGSHPRFAELLAEVSDQTTAAALLDAIVPLVPGLRAGLEAGIDVLDVDCGAGRALHLLAETFPNSRFLGCDPAPEAIERARAEAGERGLNNARFEVRDAAELGVASGFDLVTAFDAVHGGARPAAALAAIARALRPAGTFLLQSVRGASHVERDAEHPLAPFLYTVSCLGGMTLVPAAHSTGLDATWGEQTARRMLAAAGFASVEVHSLPHDPIHRYTLARRSS